MALRWVSTPLEKVSGQPVSTGERVQPIAVGKDGDCLLPVSDCLRAVPVSSIWNDSVEPSQIVGRIAERCVYRNGIETEQSHAECPSSKVKRDRREPKMFVGK